MSAEVSHEPTTRELLDGSRIDLREVRADDKQAIADGFSRLSPESRYRRFFSARDRLSPSDLRYLTEVDHRDHEAVIAFDEPATRSASPATSAATIRNRPRSRSRSAMPGRARAPGPPCWSA